MLVLAVNDLRHNGNRCSSFFFSSANVRSFEILRPNAMGLALAFRVSVRDTCGIGLTELTRQNWRRVDRKSLATFFSSFSENVDTTLPVDRDRFALPSKRLFRSVMVPVLIAPPDDFFEFCLAIVWMSLNICKVVFRFDDRRFGGAGGLTGTNVCTDFGNGPNRSMGRDMFVMG